MTSIHQQIRHSMPKPKSSLFTACCSCSKGASAATAAETIPNDDNKNDVQKGFFKRIQFFKAQKRQSIARKQQLAAATSSSSAASPSHSSPSDPSSISESDRLFNESNEADFSSIPPSSPYRTTGQSTSSTAYSPRRIRTSRSIPMLHRSRDRSSPLKDLSNVMDCAYSFTDIEVASTMTEDHLEIQKRLASIPSQYASILRTEEDHQPIDGTPKSFNSRNFSSMATNLSAYSTQSLLKKLLDKAQVLNEYYNEICHQNAHPTERTSSPRPQRASSISNNSLLGRTGATPRSFLHRDRSEDSIRKTRRKRSSISEHPSTDSSRFDLYADEDNVLKELIRFNNDIDLILSRLEMEGETLQNPPVATPTKKISSSSAMIFDENERPMDKLPGTNLIEETSIYRSDDSGLAASPAMPVEHEERERFFSLSRQLHLNLFDQYLLFISIGIQILASVLQADYFRPSILINDTLEESACITREDPDQATLHSNEVITMRTNTNEINLHLLLCNDVNRLREAALSKLLKLTEENCSVDIFHHHQNLTITKLNKLPKSITWKNKRVFGVPLRVYQQTTGQILPVPIANALQYVRMNAGKCEGLFRKPGVKSKIDRLRAEIEANHLVPGEAAEETIKFDDYQPFVVADVIRQYFRELPECLMPPSLTRLLCDLIKSLTQEDQLLAIRYVFLLLPDETRDVLETILRFLLDVSIRSGNSQTTCRSLARIFVPSIFQSYHDHHHASKILWWKWKKEKLDAIQQESERLTLELCLMTMILNVDLLCRIPSSLSDELKLPTARKSKRLDDLVRQACHGEFHIKKFIGKDSEQFLQRLSTTKFKHVPSHFDGVELAIHKASDDQSLPIWKCQIDLPTSNIKQISQRLTHERYLWDAHFAESRTVEKIDDDKEIVQYVLNFLDLVPVRSFCEFRFAKKIASRSSSDANAMLISAISIDHLQNHFLPGSIGQTHEMHYYLAPSTSQPGYTTVTQIACVDFSGRSSQWYENVFGCLLAHNLVSLRDTFTNSKLVKV